VIAGQGKSEQPNQSGKATYWRFQVEGTTQRWATSIVREEISLEPQM
jgi:hypothetical protein